MKSIKEKRKKVNSQVQSSNLKLLRHNVRKGREEKEGKNAYAISQVQQNPISSTD